jgi:predicted O-methyltransferase YrrM
MFPLNKDLEKVYNKFLKFVKENAKPLMEGNEKLVANYKQWFVKPYGGRSHRTQEIVIDIIQSIEANGKNVTELKIVDLACGVPYLWDYLYNKFNITDIVGIDLIKEETFEKMLSLIKNNPFKNSYYKMRAEDFLADTKNHEKYDLIISGNNLLRLKDIEVLAKQNGSAVLVHNYDYSMRVEKVKLEVVSSLMSAYNNNRGNVVGNYGTFFLGLTTILNPKLIVEIGTCKGYSAIYFAKGLKLCHNNGKLHCYDLWEKESKKSNIAEEERNTHLVPKRSDFERTVKENNVDDVVKIYTEEAFSALKNYEDDSIDMIHLDIGNDGDVLYCILSEVLRTLKKGGYFLYEGGAEWRDEIKWMKKYDKKPLAPQRRWVAQYFETLVIDQYPSLTVCKRVK